MADRINRFLEGKKKYSVFIATFITGIITMAVRDPQQAAELQEFVPFAAMVLSGIVYLVIEGWNDARRAQAQQAYYAALAQTQTAAADTAPPPAQDILSAGRQTGAPPQPFDGAEFTRQLHAAAAGLAKTAFPDAPNAVTSIYRAAEAVGRKTECNDIREALAYWDYLAGLAEDAWKDLEFGRKDSNGCKVFPPELYEFRATLKRVNTCYQNLQKVAASGEDWRRYRDPVYGPTLYSVGALIDT